jgi:hypothetical protein
MADRSRNAGMSSCLAHHLGIFQIWMMGLHISPHFIYELLVHFLCLLTWKTMLSFELKQMYDACKVIIELKYLKFLRYFSCEIKENVENYGVLLTKFCWSHISLYYTNIKLTQ